MKRCILLIVFGMFLITSGYATEPFPTEEYVSPTERYRIVLSPGLRGEDPDREALVVFDEKEGKDYSFSIEELGIGYAYQKMVLSTAGLGWYRNSIAVFDDDEHFFVMELPWQQLIVVDLERLVVDNDPSEDLLKEAKGNVAILALEWLDSEDPYHRETGAMVCKDLKISEGIPKLKALLGDKAYYKTYSGNNNGGMIILYVRKAAKEALLALGENVYGVRTELPEKDCLKFQNWKYVVDWKSEKCGGGQRITKEQALKMAEEICEEKGWEWVDVRVLERTIDGNEVWEIQTHGSLDGAKAIIVINKDGGEVLK